MNGSFASSALRWPLLWGLLFLLMGAPGLASGESAPPAGSEFRKPDEAGEPKQLIGIAVYLLIAVTIMTVSFWIFVLLWGVRVRRQVRKPLPAIKPNDPLWYLKTKKPSPPEPNPSAGVSDQRDSGENPRDENH